ncbi:MAG: SBBP repeat-containing protein [Bryobacteraceae bacterium]
MRLTTATLLLTVVPGFSATLPLFFFPNTGQADSSVQYIVQTPDLSARFRRDAALFQVAGQHVGVRFVDANPDVTIEGVEPLAAKISFFLGRGDWKTDVPSYARIVYRELYKGVALSYSSGPQLKSEFVIAPRADPGLIRLEYSEPVRIDAAGNLIAGGTFREAAPEIYQQIGGNRVKIAGRYHVFDAHRIGFEIGAYDRSTPLVIDPVISYCTLLGGSSPTAITGLAVDSSDNLYVTGWTSALDFPIDGAVQAVNAGGVDAIVAKLNAAGTALIYATYIGGRSTDQGAAIAVDSLGQAYVTGFTSSSNFPLVSSNRGAIGGSTTAFALKLNAAGNTLLYSGYIGGTNYEVGTAIAVDGNGNAYLAGNTESSNFPTLNPTQAAIGGAIDAFITKLNSAGAITFSTFLGGGGNENAGGIAVDSLGDIYVAGGTFSTNFPVVLPLQHTNAGGQDAFLTKISYTGTVAFSTYFGGSGGSTESPEEASAVALDSAGNAYLAGVTNSTNFPVSTGAFPDARL